MLKKANIPHKSGVYLFKNAHNQIIYVGKAIDLNKRVSSYFSQKVEQNPRLNNLVSEITDLEFIVVESELESLILEANLIKKYFPRYNVRLTDDKDYLYIVITKENFPKVTTSRKKELNKFKEYFGPYPSSKTVKETLRSLRKVFPWCSNPLTKKRPCFYYHLKLCPGACVDLISKQEYNKIIHRFIKFLEGKKEELLKELIEEMEIASGKLEFEKAISLKRTINGIEYLTQSNKIAKYLENPNFLADQNKQALNELKKALNLEELPERIEAYDISNIQGKDASGSLVVLTNGEVDKSQYRKFKIRISGKPNDYAMHLEMMRRRLNHPEWSNPQLMLIDGGRGQVRAAKEALDQKGIRIPLYGLAKRMEWLYPPEGEIVKLPKRSLALRLLQKIRDEAHRFAVSYHRKLRKKSFGLS